MALVIKPNEAAAYRRGSIRTFNPLQRVVRSYGTLTQESTDPVIHTVIRKRTTVK